ncbi:hypothetical protein AB0J86_03535 [Micromonospora sp. NPDC049559]|uniref:hypothetical protein n=1 Tax=Micromonospora sp. NPDC049559 TaxID=3155923 RepID=UPI00342B66D0
MHDLARWLEESAPVAALRDLPWSYPALECAHLLGISLLLGGAALFDLRLLGAFPGLPLPVARQTLLPAARAGFGLAAVTGLALFALSARDYLDNPAVTVKLLLLAAAGLNVALFHTGAGRAAARAASRPDRAVEPSTTRPSRVVAGHAVASLLLWTAVLVAGRLIAYL